MAALLPGYFQKLESGASKARYREKIELAGGFDPYEISKGDWCALPEISGHGN